MDLSILATQGSDPVPLRRRLREATSEIHAALDTRFQEIGWSAPGYHTFVRMNDVCHRALEPWLASLLPARERETRSWFTEPLARDMSAMALEPMPFPALPFARSGLAEAAGVTYVLDGSRLGARMIARHLAADPALQQRGLTTHYLDAAAAPGPVFAAFDQLASRLAELDAARAIDAACRTFALFGAMSEYAATR